MATIPKKVTNRYTKSVSKFQRILKIAHDKDINEADTVSIIQDILAEVFGFKKYMEITSEYAIRNMYCDLAIKIEDKIQYLIEVKAIGLNLKDHHLRQAINYGVNKGVQWIVLTNGIIWELYKIRFEKPISYDLVSSLKFLEVNPRKKDDQEKLFLLSKEGISKSIREEFYEKVQSVNRFFVGAIILNSSVINVIQKNIKELSSGLKVREEEIEKILRNEVLKRDTIEGEEASKAIKKVKRFLQKKSKKRKLQKIKKDIILTENNNAISVQLNKEDERQ